MAIITEPRSGIKYGWDFGSNNWNVDMDQNLRDIGRFGLHLSAISMDIADPPTSPASGDIYIIPASATGDWAAAAENDIAYYNGSNWVFHTPRKGYICLLEDLDRAVRFNEGVWSALGLKGYAVDIQLLVVSASYNLVEGLVFSHGPLYFIDMRLDIASVDTNDNSYISISLYKDGVADDYVSGGNFSLITAASSIINNPSGGMITPFFVNNTVMNLCDGTGARLRYNSGIFNSSGTLRIDGVVRHR